ncbi:MAG: ATP-binding protein [bacterium]|nr:ATP-binding protein [bacterium]
MRHPTLQAGEFVNRHAEARVRVALTDTRIVALVGPRQSGKTTLARRIAEHDGRPFITLDDEQSRRFADDDPAGFIRSLGKAVIDEVQRSPELILALKRAVDEDPRPGRFLLTGSVDLFKGSISPDSLAGRVESIELLPLSQAEIAGLAPSGFLARAFAGDFPGFQQTGPTTDLVERVVSGGFPEALSRPAPARRRAWLRSYVRSVASRDILDLSSVRKSIELTRLVDHAAVSAGGLLNLSSLGSRLGLDSKTVDRWLVLLEHLFLIRRVRAWHHREMKRLVKAPKLYFLDSGLLAMLLRADAVRLAADRKMLGPLLECFVHGELAKAVALSDETTAISHYRDKDGVEVDLVLERSPGAVVGIETKAAVTVRPRDFRGLKRLGQSAGDSFVCGILLHGGDRIQQVAPRLFAMPLKMLWEA